jgi:hypothetical protein
MEVLVREHHGMIAAAVQGDVGGVADGAHGVGQGYAFRTG